MSGFYIMEMSYLRGASDVSIVVGKGSEIACGRFTVSSKGEGIT